MDRTEVTVAAYKGCADAGKCATPGTDTYCNWGKDGKSNHPINCVSWNDAMAYCLWAGKRLPTETEWEYAARGTEGREYPWGSAGPTIQLCWHLSDGTCAVGSYPSGNTPQGLVDMAGNVWEWTASNDCPYPSENCANAARVNRGGSWYNDDTRAFYGAFRDSDEPASRDASVGFRCAR
jgi:formylglycine-generating enzyme required for sulfatase activity